MQFSKLIDGLDLFYKSPKPGHINLKHIAPKGCGAMAGERYGFLPIGSQRMTIIIVHMPISFVNR